MIPLLLLSMACGRDECTATQEPAWHAQVDPPSSTTLPDTSPPLVLLLTIDTLNRDFLGVNNAWDTSPVLDALIAESTVFPEVVVTRSLTKVSLTSLQSGLYPRTTGIHSNDDTIGWTPNLFTWFRDAGYRTYGYSSNCCDAFQDGTDEYLCTSRPESDAYVTQTISDATLVDQFLASIADLSSDQPVFAWLHFIAPHADYLPVEPWASHWVSAGNTSQLDLSKDALLKRILEPEPLSADDLELLHAVYASQIRELDATIGRLFEGLQGQGRWDGAMVILGADHGEELGQHDNYIFHGCSIYPSVLSTLWAFKGPGIPAITLRGRASGVDIAPTLLDLARLPAPDCVEGRSRVPDVFAGELAVEPLFYERTSTSAGVILGDWQYNSTPKGEFTLCEPYNVPGHPYVQDREELFYLPDDPYGLVNLATTDPDRLANMRDTLCEWAGAGPWPSEGKENVLLDACGIEH